MMMITISCLLFVVVVAFEKLLIFCVFGGNDSCQYCVLFVFFDDQSDVVVFLFVVELLHQKSYQ